MSYAKLLWAAMMLLLAACGTPETSKKEDTPAPSPAPADPTARALPAVLAPADNPSTPEKVALGKQLFFDKRLSKNGDMSCETCHVPKRAGPTAMSSRRRLTAR
jgi:cytochrome c peroxidase